MTTNISKINEIFDYLENEENTDIKSIHLLIKEIINYTNILYLKKLN